MTSRVILIFSFVILLWALLIARGADLQVLPNPKLEKLKQRQFLTKIKMPGRRGVIYDRRGRELAVSMRAYSLFADPKLLESPKKVSARLAKLLKMPYRKTANKLLQMKKRGRRFTWLKRKLDRKVMLKIKSWGARGLGFIEEEKRIYPNGMLATQVLGLVGSEGQGLEGIEKYYNQILAGEDKWLHVRRDARGRPLMVNSDWMDQNLHGEDIHLTLDRDLQFRLEQELQAAVSKHKADSAVGVILDVASSEVLAMANLPSLDPHVRASRAQWALRRNRVVTDAFEPGSTMKTLAIAAALEEKTTSANKRYFCENGQFRVGRRIIREADEKHSFGWLTTSEILAHSSNVGTSKIAFELGASHFDRKLRRFGFGRPTGVDLPGEVAGIMNPLPWRKHLLANVSFDHGIAVTPLQMANSYAMIARGGVFKTPRVLKHIQNKVNGEVRILNPEDPGLRVLDADVAQQLILMLSAVTGPGGSGWNARVSGFPVAGKTGTAQKVDPKGRGYLKGAYISSFAGFIPAHSPKYVIYIAVDNPKKAYYGSQVSAPVFSRVASYAVRKAGLVPVLISEKNLLPTRTRRKVAGPDVRRSRTVLSKLVPELRGLNLREVFQRVQSQDVKVKIFGHGRVVKTHPMAGFPLPEGEPIEVHMAQ